MCVQHWSTHMLLFRNMSLVVTLILWVPQLQQGYPVKKTSFLWMNVRSGLMLSPGLCSTYRIDFKILSLTYKDRSESWQHHVLPTDCCALSAGLRAVARIFKSRRFLSLQLSGPPPAAQPRSLSGLWSLNPKPSSLRTFPGSSLQLGLQSLLQVSAFCTTSPTMRTRPCCGFNGVGVRKVLRFCWRVVQHGEHNSKAFFFPSRNFPSVGGTESL